MNPLKRFTSLSTCSRTGLALWLASGILALLLAGLSSGTAPLATGAVDDATPVVTGNSPRPNGSGSR